MPQQPVPQPRIHDGDLRRDLSASRLLVQNHGMIAAYLDDWADRVRGEVSHGRGLGTLDQEYLIGYQRALTDLASHLREGDALPGGPLYRHPRMPASG